MAQNYIQPGKDITVTAPSTVTSGQPVMVGDGLFGVAHVDAATGDPVTIGLEGIWELPKVSALAIDVGDIAYFVTGSGLVTNDGGTGGANPMIGVAVTAAANPSATVNVKLLGVVLPAPAE